MGHTNPGTRSWRKGSRGLQVGFGLIPGGGSSRRRGGNGGQRQGPGGPGGGPGLFLVADGIQVLLGF